MMDVDAFEQYLAGAPALAPVAPERIRRLN
jgi:hypothetical protein